MVAWSKALLTNKAPFYLPLYLIFMLWLTVSYSVLLCHPEPVLRTEGRFQCPVHHVVHEINTNMAENEANVTIVTRRVWDVFCTVWDHQLCDFRLHPSSSPPACSRSFCFMMMLGWLLSSLSRPAGESVPRGSPQHLSVWPWLREKENYSGKKMHHTPSFTPNQAVADLWHGIHKPIFLPYFLSETVKNVTASGKFSVRILTNVWW